MGEVYLGRHAGLNRFDAIKLPLEGLCGNAKVMLRFEREAMAMAKLRHNNICRIHHVGRHGPRPFMAMEYVDGKPLSRFVGRLTLKTIGDLLTKIASAIDYAHGRGVIHRDLKPDNIMLAERQEPVLMDFGLARVIDCDPITEPRQILGTPHYMSPEQVRGESESIGPTTDTYALGATLYELLTGQRPYDGGSWISVCCKIVDAPPPKPSSVREYVSPELDQICLKAMAKCPRDRYQTASALAEDFCRCANATGHDFDAWVNTISNPDRLAVATTLVHPAIGSP